MNDPNKVIKVNLSSLLSLKAEVLRKQAEAIQAKTKREIAVEHVAKKSNLPKANHRTKESENVKIKNPANVDNYADDAELLAKSQRVLQAKSKYYEHMTRTGGKLNSDDNCLVLFNRKLQEERPMSSDSDSFNEELKNIDSEDEEDWVEYTDCLGRTRKCLAADLENAKKRDAELAASMPERLDQSKANWLIDTTKMSTSETNDDLSSIIGPFPTESLCSEALTVISKQEEVRANWERKEQENLEKPDVHYQDVFFDEARQHGTGYYAFSIDEEERRKQQQDLETARQQTIEEQANRDALRAQREKIIAERVLAAKNRQRARQGLSPITQDDLDAEKAKQRATEQVETKEARKERKKLEQAQRNLQKEEEAREIERQQHIRPWDKKKVGAKSSNETMKDDDVWVYKSERMPMSQEEWNEKQRSERKAEFAPPTDKPQKRTNFNSETTSTHCYELNNNFANYQSTKKERKSQRRNCETNENTTAINEMKGVTIPPPANLDEDIPVRSKRARTGADLENSIEVGLRFLRNSYDKDSLTSKTSWSAKIDY